MRERHSKVLLNGLYGRITPAYAGKTNAWSADSLYHRDHPAYAGKTLLDHITFRRNQDHPRLCGKETPSQT